MTKLPIEFTVTEEGFKPTTPVSEIRKHTWNRTNYYYKALRAYLEAMLWSSNDESDPETGGDPMDQNYDLDDISDELLLEAAAVVGITLLHFPCNEELFTRVPVNEYEIIDVYGHDLWLTIAGHGAGFWDGDWKEPLGQEITDWIHKKFGYCDGPYVGDDNKIYMM